MRKRWNRRLAWLLCAAVCLTLLPAAALAAEYPTITAGFEAANFPSRIPPRTRISSPVWAPFRTASNETGVTGMVSPPPGSPSSA